MRKDIFYSILISAWVPFASIAQTHKTINLSQPPALSAIKESDLRTDIFAMAGDHFRGREAGTLDELKVSMWWANQLRMAGLKPAGDDGTYFQYFTMKRNRISSSTAVSLAGRPLQLWKDV